MPRRIRHTPGGAGLFEPVVTPVTTRPPILDEGRRRRRRERPLAVTLLVASFLLMTFDVRTEGQGPTDVLRTGTQSLIAPLQDAVATVVRPVSDFVSRLTTLARQQEELQRLQAELAAARSELAKVESYQLRIRQLEQLTRLPAVENLPATNANVIAEIGPLDKSFAIDRGTEDGVLVGHPVVDVFGNLVGKVVSTTAGSAIVVPIVGDVDAVMVLAGEQVGTLSARVGSRLLDLDIFEATGPLEAEETVVSGAGAFPPGLTIGRVVSTVQPEGNAITARVEPFADFDRLDVVVVLAWPPDPEDAVGEPAPSTTTSTSTQDTP